MGRQVQITSAKDCYAFGSRYYDSEIDRWLQVDQLPDKYHGLSLYYFVFDNPLRFTDPTRKKLWNFITALSNAILSIIILVFN